jgi:hypothetical protein
MAMLLLLLLLLLLYCLAHGHARLLTTRAAIA